MKELSIEEKAKAYDEALKAAIVASKDEDRHLKATLERIFPELTEAGDERIRKVIIKFFKLQDDKITYSLVPKKDILAWLEKHKYTEDDLDKAYKCADEVQYRRGYEDAKKEIEKQGEQKPNYCHHEVDLSECSEEYRKAYYDGWNNCNMQHSQCKSELDDVVKCLINGMKFYYEDNEEATWGTDKWSMPVKHIIEVLEKQGEQKPTDNEMIEILRAEYEKGRADAIEEMQNLTWSEKDESVLDALIRKLEGEDIYVSPHLAAECLKSLKGRVQPQPRQEWSEEDKNMITDLNIIIHTYFSEISGIQFKHDLSEDKIRTWLKSLRPQKQQQEDEWSEEDKIMKGKTINYINVARMYVDVERVPSWWADECINWLKSLRPLPKNQWSKNDELNKQDTIRLLADAKERYLQTDASIPKCIKWLESLKERCCSSSYWKASKKQLETLEFVCDNHIFSNDSHRREMESLLKQLKAL